MREDAEDKADVVEATITEAMRSRPVIPMVGRRVTVPWRLDLEAADPAPEHALHRNVTMIPAHGAKVVAHARG